MAESNPFESPSKDGPADSQPFGLAEEVAKQTDTTSPAAADNNTSNSPRKSVTIKETTVSKVTNGGRNRRGKNK